MQMYRIWNQEKINVTKKKINKKTQPLSEIWKYYKADWLHLSTTDVS